MQLFLSGEIAFKANKPFDRVFDEVRSKLDRFEKADPLDDTYGTEFNDIAIITMVLGGDKCLESTPERRLVRHKARDADIRLKIDYKRFIKANKHTQMLLYVKNIVDSIMVVEERKKGDFNGEKLIADILLTLGIDKEQIANL